MWAIPVIEYSTHINIHPLRRTRVFAPPNSGLLGLVIPLSPIPSYFSQDDSVFLIRHVMCPFRTQVTATVRNLKMNNGSCKIMWHVIKMHNEKWCIHFSFESYLVPSTITSGGNTFLWSHLAAFSNCINRIGGGWNLKLFGVALRVPSHR